MTHIIVLCSSPDDEYVAAGSSDGGVYIWHVATSKLHSVLKDHRYMLLSIHCCINYSWLYGSQKFPAFYVFLSYS